MSDFHSRDLAQAGVFFIAIVGLNILTGYTGQISLGHGALMAIGGYTTAALACTSTGATSGRSRSPGIAAGIVGFVIGLPALRLSGLYLALATFAFAVAIPSLLKKFSGLTGGGQGLRLLEQAPLQVTGLSGTVTIFGHSTTQNHFLYYLTWAIGLVGFVIAWLIVRGRLGRTFRAVRDSEVAAASAGVDLARAKTLAFAISGVYAGVAGALLAIQDEIVNPLSFTFLLSILLLVGAVVGGLGSLPGMVVGAFFVQYLPDLSTRVSSAPGVPDFIFGAAIILVMILLPSGVGGLLRAACRTPNNPAIHSSLGGHEEEELPNLCAPARSGSPRSRLARHPPGVTSTQILIGGTTPLSGPASAYQSVAKGAAAYFRYVNPRAA